jgi:DNA-binding Xre family transcriptional regulator
MNEIATLRHAIDTRKSIERLTNAQLAERLGISEPTLYRLQRGQMPRIARALLVLLTETRENNQNTVGR